MYEQTGSNSSASTLIYYDEKSRPAELYYTMSYLVGNVNTVSETTHKNTYDNEGKLTKYKVSEGSTSYSFMPTYDDFGRVNYKMNVLQTSSGALSSMMDYEYSTNEQYTRWESTQVSKYVWSLGSNISEYNYVYDDNGNIIEIKDDDGVIQHRYEYDILGQLIREDNRPLGKSYVYIYDYAGNRTVKREGAFTLGTVTVTNTVNYDYGNEPWGDQLTSAGENYYSYDDIGNMVIRYSDGVHATLTWDGRRLESYEDGTGYYFAYKYDSDGRRISKTSGRGGTTPTVYQYNGDQLVCESFNGSIRYYIYDENGSIAGMRYRTSSYAEGVFDEYFFEKNLQGDVVAVYNASGTKFISYKYDAWGNFTTTYHNGGASTTAVNNPFRYRGYYYDSDTGLYYLNSRYYDPVTGRFISADIYVSTGQGIIGHNMYAYCLNNPVNMYDPNGRCSRFLGFLWKIDCKQASCPDSKNYVKPKAIDPIGSYNKGQGYVYVVTEDQLDIMEEREKNVVVIVDKRTSSDPNMQMQDSYRITKTKQQKEIAQLMLNYNTSNPVEPVWSRTLDSLVEEWKLHNLAYNLGYKRERTGDCDFNNADEGMGFWGFIGR